MYQPLQRNNIISGEKAALKSISSNRCLAAATSRVAFSLHRGGQAAATKISTTSAMSIKRILKNGRRRDQKKSGEMAARPVT